MPAKKSSQRNRRNKKSTHNKSSLSYPRLIITTAITIVFIFGLSQLNRLDSQTDNLAQRQNNSSINSDERKPTTAESEKKPSEIKEQYAFYSMLKDFSVKIPAQNEYSNVPTKKQPNNYLIQAGSFKTARQAEQRLVELTLLGLEPTISDTVNAQGNTWFRVRLGPFFSRTDMASARNTIISNGMEAMVMAR